MSLKTFDPKSVLQRRPFVTGMATALDIYGVRGLKDHELIWDRWQELKDGPRPSAEESIRDSIAEVNDGFQRLAVETSE